MNSDLEKTMGKKVITEKDVMMIPQNGSLRIDGDYLLTPAAKDILQSRNINIEEITAINEDLVFNTSGEEDHDIFPENSSRIVISIFGVDNPGVIAAFSQALAEENISIHDVSQRIVGKLFTLFMVVNLGARTKEYSSIKKKLSSLAGKLNVKIYIQHESIFQYMHRI